MVITWPAGPVWRSSRVAAGGVVRNVTGWVGLGWVGSGQEVLKYDESGQVTLT